jgi:hypothetical protein
LNPKALQNARNLKSLDTSFGHQDWFQIPIQMISVRRPVLQEPGADATLKNSDHIITH